VPSAVIELDVTDGWEPPDRPRPRNTLPRTVAAALVLVLLLAGGGGAQRAASYRPAFTLEAGTQHILADDMVFSVNERIVSAYRLTDGTLLWSKPFALDARLVTAEAGRLVLDVAAGAELFALNAADGEIVWQRSGFAPAFVIGEHVLTIVAEQLVAGIEAYDGGRGERLVGIDIRTGTVRWSIDTPDSSRRALQFPDRGAVGGRVMAGELGRDGRLRVRDLGSGEVTRTVQLADVGEVGSFDMSIGQIIVYRTGGHEGAVFDLATGRWTWTFPVDQRLGLRVGWCGPLMCRTTHDSVTGLDPDTGRWLWHLGGFNAISPLTDDRLLISRYDTASGQRDVVVIVDAVNGKPLRYIERWHVLDIASWPRLLAWQADRSGKATLAWLNAETGRTTVVGQIDRLYSDPSCQVTAAILACTHGQLLSVWRQPAAA